MGKEVLKRLLKKHNQKPRKQRAFPGRWDAAPQFDKDLLFPIVFCLNSFSEGEVNFVGLNQISEEMKLSTLLPGNSRRQGPG